LEKIDTHEGVTVKALLDSGVIGMFIDRKFAEKQGFKLDQLKKPLRVTIAEEGLHMRWNAISITEDIKRG